MGRPFIDLLSTPAVLAARELAYGAAARREQSPPGDGSPEALGPDLGPDEAAFIAARDHFFMASVSENGWPYVQHRGGAAGFLHVADHCASPSPTTAATANC